MHIAFGHVLGMKTRGDGNTNELNEFLNEFVKNFNNANKTNVRSADTNNKLQYEEIS